MISPCVSICALDPASGLCTGCLRTIDEIAGWASMTDDERHDVWCAIEARAAEARGPGDAVAGGGAP